MKFPPCLWTIVHIDNGVIEHRNRKIMLTIEELIQSYNIEDVILGATLALIEGKYIDNSLEHSGGYIGSDEEYKHEEYKLLYCSRCYNATFKLKQDKILFSELNGVYYSIYMSQTLLFFYKKPVSVSRLEFVRLILGRASSNDDFQWVN